MWQYILTHSPLLYLVQSLWRDEAFSVLVAGQPLSFIISRLGFEPPLYYALLHFWVKIFGTGEIAVRSLSLLGFLLSTIIVIEWAGSVYKKHWLSWYVPVIYFFNPMLLYYAFEVRTYGWYTFFAVAMLFSYITKKWHWFILSAVLGFYTHVYVLFFIVALAAHWILTSWTGLAHWKTFAKDRGTKSFLTIFLLSVPWIVKIILEAGKLKQSWYFPVDLQLVLSVIGNMFVGYEGTPWYGWVYTRYLSLVILIFTALALRNSKHKRLSHILAIFAFVPLFIVVGVSFIKPVFVNRYLIPTTIAEVLLVSVGLAAIKHKVVQKIAASVILLFILLFNWWFPSQHKKLPFRETFVQIQALKKEQDIILASHPIVYLESLYYAPNPQEVYWYNPDRGTFPWFVGDAVVKEESARYDYPLYPNRAILVKPDATFEIVYRVPMRKDTQ